jgi:hypothetical protein
MSKEYALLRDVIVKYHPFFVGKPTRIKDALANPELFNITGMIEQCLANASGGQYTLAGVTGAVSDFSDKSDSKTVTVSRYSTGAIRGEVHGINTKIGSLRIVIYNSVEDRTDYMYIPADQVHNFANPCFGKRSYDTRLPLYYTLPRDSYNRFDRFRVPSFLVLASAMY